jgi:hypothetical protein
MFPFSATGSLEFLELRMRRMMFRFEVVVVLAVVPGQYLGQPCEAESRLGYLLKSLLIWVLPSYRGLCNLPFRCCKLRIGTQLPWHLTHGDAMAILFSFGLH